LGDLSFAKWNSGYLIDRAYPGADLRQAGLRFSIVELNVLISHFEERRKSGVSIIILRFSDAPLVDILSASGSQIDATVSMSSRPDCGALAWFPTTRGSRDPDRVNYWNALRAILQSLRLSPLFAPDAHETVPFPERPTLEIAELLAITSWPERGPPALGAKRTLMEQVCPEEIPAGAWHVLVWEKSPLTTMGLTRRVSVPLLVSVTFSGALTVPTPWSGKARIVADGVDVVAGVSSKAPISTVPPAGRILGKESKSMEMTTTALVPASIPADPADNL
jgi:hypothetical protein